MEISSLELESKTKFQQDLYYQKDGSDEQVTSNFYREFNKTSFWVPIDERLELITLDEGRSDDTLLSYRVNINYNSLLYTKLRLKLPPIKVKDEFKDSVRICWTRYLGHNICNNTRFTIDSKEYQSFPKQWYDINYQFNIQNNKKDEYKYFVGDIPMLTNWTNHLPGFTLNVPQPFFFSKDISQSINLSHFDVKEATFTYSINRMPEKLLRVQIMKDNTWIETENPSFETLDAVLDGLPRDLPLPELWARYSIHTSDENDWRKNCTDNQCYYIENIINCSPPNNFHLGTIAEAKLTSLAPCKKIYWMAQNLTSLKHNLYSNYTTSNSTIEKGWNPCSKVIIKYGQKIRYTSEQDEFSHLVPFYHSIGTPSDNGYCCYSYSNDPETLDADIAIPYKDEKIIYISLSDTDPYKIPVYKINKKVETTKDDIPKLFIKDENIKYDQDNQYSLHVFLVSYRKVEWKKNDLGKMILSISDHY